MHQSAAERSHPETSQEATEMTPAQQRFLDAWKSSVEIAGKTLFHSHVNHHFERAKHWRDLRPDVKAITRCIHTRSGADAAFISLLVGFYNDIEGDKLLKKTGTTLGKLPLVLTLKQRSLYAELMTNFKGW